MASNVSTFQRVAHDSAQESLLGRVADEQLLADERNLPVAVGRPAQVEPSSSRRWIVGLGATLTGATLLAGIALLILGVVGLIGSGFSGLTVAALAVGAVLVATHWGWVHVAEWTATGLEGRRERQALDRREQWLLAIQPYTRYEVSTSVGDDGSITIVRTRHRPVPAGEGRFKFETAVEQSEVHSPDESSASVAERAEELRRQAALDTETERRRFEEEAGEQEVAQLRAQAEQRLRAELRAQSQALSERINANLRDPPLTE
jgi:hypothetical protein